MTWLSRSCELAVIIHKVITSFVRKFHVKIGQHYYCLRLLWLNSALLFWLVLKIVYMLVCAVRKPKYWWIHNVPKKQSKIKVVEMLRSVETVKLINHVWMNRMNKVTQNISCSLFSGLEFLCIWWWNKIF